MWRVGTKLGRTLYENEVFVGVVDTPEIAERIVRAMNSESPRQSQHQRRLLPGGLPFQVVELLSVRDAALSAEDVANALGSDIDTTRTTLCKLHHRKRIRRVAWGLYRSTQ